MNCGEKKSEEALKIQQDEQNAQRDPGEDDLKSGFSVYFPKFENMVHWPRLIRRFGPVWWQDTARGEYMHQTGKALIHCTNHYDTSRDINNLTDRLLAVKKSPFYEPLEKETHKSSNFWRFRV